MQLAEHEHVGYVLCNQYDLLPQMFFFTILSVSPTSINGSEWAKHEHLARLLSLSLVFKAC